MELKQIQHKQNQITKAILSGELSKAFNLIPELAYQARNGSLISELELLEVTYKNILRYSFGYAKDPERDKIYNNLRRQLIELNDDLVASIFNNSDTWFLKTKRSELTFLSMNEKEKTSVIDEMSNDMEFSHLLKEVNSEINSENLNATYSNSLQSLFDTLWLTANYTEGEKLLCDKFFKANHIPWHDKSLIVSAVFLSALNHFDSNKIEILFKIYDLKEPQVWHRALISIFILLLVNESRLSLYPEIKNRIKSVVDPVKFARQFEQITLQFIRAQETEKVTTKIQKEIIPEVMKLRPEIEEKLKLDDLLNKDNLEDKNPDWKNFFSESPDVYKKLEEFSMMQMDGSDVFMGAFSLLKRFGFFEKLSNWFLPFYKEHQEIKKSVKGVADNFNWQTFFEGIEEAPVMCNSDKYSFCFNLGFMPDMQKTMMLEFFNQELDQMKEVIDDENKHNASARDKMIFTQYIQDLYRFFKLHSDKKFFSDVFELELNVTDSEILQLIFQTKNNRQIAEFYFTKNYFKKALKIFLKLNSEKNSFEIIEKIGYCYQQLGDFNNAIIFYKQAEIIETEKPWLQKKLGYCYRKTGNYTAAIEYYKKVEKEYPDNLEIQAHLGQLHIEKEDYNTALKYYFKVEYLKPDLAKVQRPIGWCSFLLGKNEQALRYFNKVAESEGERSDYLNLAHCNWVSGNLSDAIDNYRTSLKQSGKDFVWFRATMIKDSIYLKSYGLDELEIALMTDYIIMMS
ncbi:MAG: tetratricopeptide repeat protein [Bacteroidales bacterium]|nr:tetratricopeptide repeat protein [Bacteroidales bacterium]MBN2818866.1 tetratricopeptide repeat protein [Bacteroidales bacterium]